MSTQITLPLHTTSTRFQWAVLDKRTKKIVRPALTRQSARNKAKLSRHYRVVRRTIIVGNWSPITDGKARKVKKSFRVRK